VLLDIVKKIIAINFGNVQKIREEKLIR